MDQVLHQLVEVLRRSEIRISPAETLDAFKVLRNVGIDNKSLLREALALTLAKSIHEKIIFYEILLIGVSFHNKWLTFL